MSNTMFTNFGRSVISDALSSDKKLTFSKIAFGDKGTTPNKSHDVNAIGLINERFRMNLDSVYYPPQSSDNNAIVKITATLTPEQADSMDPVSVREFGLIDSEGNFLVLGDTVTTLTKEGSNANGIAFEFYVTLPSPEKIVNVVLSSGDGSFSEAFRIKLTNIEENATKNKTDSFLLDRSNHTGKQTIETIENLTILLDELNNKIVSNKSNYKGIFLNHSTFLNNNDISDNAITNDNYFNIETSSLWYYNIDKVWVDGNATLNEKINTGNSYIKNISTGMDKINDFFNKSTPLGVIEAIASLPDKPNFNAEENSYSNTYYYAYVLETKSTWVYVPTLDGETVIGGAWINLNGFYPANPLLDRSNHTGKQTVDTIEGLEEYLNSVISSSNFKGIFTNHNDFIEANRKYNDGEEPVAGNVTDSIIGDNYLNMSTKSKWYYVGNGIWLDLNLDLVTEINNLKNNVNNISLGLSDFNDLFSKGTPLGIFNSFADLPLLPNYDEVNDVFSSIIYYAFVKDSKSVWIFDLEYNEGNVIGGTWVNLNSDIDTYKNKLEGIETGAQVNPTIVDNLTTNDSYKVLSAKQGVILKNALDTNTNNISNIMSLLQSDDTTLDEIQEIVNYIKSNKSTLDNLSIDGIIGLTAALADKQTKLISGTNIKTINSTSLLGNGNIDVASINDLSPSSSSVYSSEKVENMLGDIGTILDNINGVVI